MIISYCPLRISLVGGSTDSPSYLEKYKTGSVISFASNFKTYTVVHRDVIGYNSVKHKYIINYSDKETVDSVDEIKNDLVRCCFKELSVSEINCFLTSDVFSTGSGLASSSSYLMSLIKSINHLNNIDESTESISKLAFKIEKKFNPLVGQQDFYGGSIGGLKKITFFNDKDPLIEFLDVGIFDKFDMFLYFTDITRQSTNILKTIDIDKSKFLLDEVDHLYKSIKSNNVDLFMSTMKKSWNLKKQTSPHICSGDLSTIDSKIGTHPDVLAHKLCGAGGGGYFLIFVKKGSTEILNDFNTAKKITISKEGLTCKEI